MSPITIFAAREIVTMNPSNPTATHVAVRDGRILGAGTLDEVAGWGDHELDTTFADQVLVPGMIEVHSHAFEGLTGVLPYQGWFDRPAPDGRTLPGIRSIDALLDDLRRIDAELADPDEPITTLGFDPIHFDDARLDRTHLDQVSTTRPIFVFHASAHLATVNTAMLERHGITRDTPTAGVGRFADGELQEMPAIALAPSGMVKVAEGLASDDCIRNLGAMARRVGVTSVGDLGGSMLTRPESVDLWGRIVAEPDFPARVTVYNLPGPIGSSADFDVAAEALLDLRRHHQTDRLRFPGVKFVLDGSIQGWTAVMNPPGYYTGADHGLLLTVPEQFVDWARPFHQAGVNLHIHCNGSATIDLALDTVEQLLRETAWLDHRHTIEHSQVTTDAQLRRARNLGMCVNIFANHLWYWGDVHYEQTLGPERANRLEPCGSAQRIGVPYSLHSDANVTPLGPLHVMWCAVNRVTPKGRVLGEEQKISAYEALWAVTMGAAYQMHLDHELGSIESGKLADFAVLDESPLTVDPMAIRDIAVHGTVVAGVPHLVR